MALSARTRELLGLTLVVLLVVSVATVAHLATLARLTLGTAADEGHLLSRQLLHQAAHVLRVGGAAASVTFRADPSLRALLDGIVGYSRVVVYGAIVDASGRTLLHSEPALQGRLLPERPLLDDALAAGVPQLTRMLLGPPQIYEVRLPVRLGEQPFGTVQVGVSTSLVRETLREALLRSLAIGAGALALAIALGLGAGRVLLGYLRRIARRVERLARRDPGLEFGPGDDMGRLAERMKGLGERIQATTGGAGDPDPAGAERLQNAVVLLSADGSVVFANATAEHLLGQELTGRPFGGGLPPAHRLASLASAVLEGGATPLRDTVTLSAGTGEAREWAISGYPLRVNAERIGALLVLRDLEPARAVESLVSYSQKLAALGRLTSGLTHEVKNPLNAMRIHLELLRARLAQSGDPAPPEIAENIDVIAHEIQRLDRVVQGFLRFARPQDLRLAPVDVNTVLSDVARLARPEAARAGVEIVLDPGRGLRRVTADAGLIAQAGANLVSNAIQAMPDGGTLVVASRRGSPSGVRNSRDRSGDRHRAGEHRQDLPPLLHDEDGWIGHRPRHGVPHRADARRPHRRRVAGRQGHHRDAHAPRRAGRAVTGLLLAALALALAGCAPFQQELPPWARPVAASSPKVASDSVESYTPAPTLTVEPVEAPATPVLPPPAAPPVTPSITPPPAPASAPAAPVRAPAPPPTPPPAPTPAPSPPPAAPPAAPSPPLTASLPPAEVRRLQEESQRRIEESERLLRQLDGRPLPPKDLETLRLARSLVEQARKALGSQEYERAANLAAKARTLAVDLTTQR